MITLAVCGRYVYTRVKTVPKPCSCAENTSRLALYIYIYNPNVFLHPGTNSAHEHGFRWPTRVTLSAACIPIPHFFTNFLSQTEYDFVALRCCICVDILSFYTSVCLFQLRTRRVSTPVTTQVFTLTTRDRSYTTS